MGKGLSNQQKAILGIAYHSSVTFPYGLAQVKWQLVANVLYKLPLGEYGQRIRRGTSTVPSPATITLNTKKNKSIKTSIVRAMKTLEKRKLLKLSYGTNNSYYPMWGYVLTKDGEPIGKDNEIIFDDLTYFRNQMLVWATNTSDKNFFTLCELIRTKKLTIANIVNASKGLFKTHSHGGIFYDNVFKCYQHDETENTMMITLNNLNKDPIC